MKILQSSFITTDSVIIEQAKALLNKYGAQGLRTLDSIQFSTALSLFHEANVFLTADKFLKSLFITEGLHTEK